MHEFDLGVQDKTRTAAWCALRDTPIYGLIGQLKLSRPWGDGAMALQ